MRASAVAAAALILLASAALFAVAWLRARLVSPEPTQLVRDRRGRFLAELGALPSGDAGYWRLDTLPPRVVAATLAIEDHRFRPIWPFMLAPTLARPSLAGPCDHQSTKENRQTRDKGDQVVALQPDFSSRRSPMLLTLLGRDLGVGLHQAMPLWLSTPPTGLAIRKTTRSMELSPDI